MKTRQTRQPYRRTHCAYDIIAIFEEATFLKEADPWPYCAGKEGKI